MKRVLVVEDNEMNLKLIKDILLHEGYDVIEAKSGWEGINKVEVEDVDLILMDIQLPEMDGIETMKRIKKIPKYGKIPIIALTSYAMKDDRDKFLSHGFTDYISKPIKIHVLLETVKKYL
jgi:two-component system cell cycle response regulator DivK